MPVKIDVTASVAYCDLYGLHRDSPPDKVLNAGIENIMSYIRSVINDTDNSQRFLDGFRLSETLSAEDKERLDYTLEWDADGDQFKLGLFAPREYTAKMDAAGVSPVEFKNLDLRSNVTTSIRRGGLKL